MTTPRAILLLSAALSIVTLGTSCQLANGRPKMTIPVTLNQQYKLILASDLGPLVLDTGAAISMVDAAFAKKHKLPKSPDTATIKDVTGATADVKMAIIPKLTIPAKEPGKSWEIHDILVAVIPNMRNKESFGSSFILGMPAFENRIVELDLPKSEIRLLHNLPFGINSKTVPLRVSEAGGNGTPGIPIKFHGSDPIYGILDTGYGEYFSLCTQAWPNTPIQEGSRKRGEGGGFLANRTFEKARASSKVTVGNITIVDSPVAQAHGSEWRHTLIGVSIWKHTTMAIDWDRRKAVFRTPWTFLNHLTLTLNSPTPQ